jgi:hypothetical protein
MIRLSGLPSAERYPVATVARAGASLTIVFGGATGSTRVDVPLDRLGPDEDQEASELRLLARLQTLGYRVEQGDPGRP